MAVALGIIVVVAALASTGSDDRGTSPAGVASDDSGSQAGSAPPTATAAPAPEPEPTLVAVPDVTGASEADAVRVLEAAGFEVAVEEQDVTRLEDQGIVLRQRPSLGAERAPGATVTIVIGGELVWSEPITVDGTGDDVVDVAIPDDQIALVRISHTGSANFAIWSYDADGDELDLLVNTIGDYDGTRAINLDDPARQFEITADGAWTIEFAPLSQARRVAADGTIDGSGDDVVVADETAPDATRAVLRHGGDGNFAIWAHADSGTDLLVNEIGPYEGTVRWPGGLVLLDITANGAWSLRLQ